MLKLTRWCIAHRRIVVVTWILVAIATSVLANAVGRKYATNYTLPGTQTQRALDLLTKEFPAESGDVDTIVFHVADGTVDSPKVQAAITPMLEKVAQDPHVVGVISPYSERGAVQISKDRKTAFATVNYSKPAARLPQNTGKTVLNQIEAVHVPGLTLAAGGQVIEAAEGFSVGPATLVGVIAALIILLITFGSLTAAGMPLITAGFGLITGTALIGIATHVTDMSNVAPELALMIGLGVGIDYALFIVTRFRESYLVLGDVHESVLQAMDTSGRAILLAGSTVVIALLGMFATGVPFMYGLSIASILAVLFTLIASLTVLPAMLSRFGARVLRTRGDRKTAPAPGDGAAHSSQNGGERPAGVSAHTAVENSRWHSWSKMVQSRPWPLAIGSVILMLVLLIPVFGLRLQSSDAGNDPSSTSTRHAFDLLADGFGPGFNGPLLVVTEFHGAASEQALASLHAELSAQDNVVAVTAPRVAPSGNVAVMQVYPGSAPQDVATVNLVNDLRQNVAPKFESASGATMLVGGFTAGSIDFSHVLAVKLPLFIGIVIVMSALLLLVIFRSILIPIQAAVMNLLSIGGALGVTVAVFEKGWLGGLLGLQRGPIEPWIPVLMFAVVFGLSMDYEVFLVSRVREEWVRHRDASEAVANGISYTGRVISAAAAIMVCVFLSFMLGDERVLREFGFGLAIAVFLDAIIVRCVMLPAVLELLGPSTWWLPAWLDRLLPDINIEGHAAREAADAIDAPSAPIESAERSVSPPIRIAILDGDETGQELLEQSIRVLGSDLLGLEIELNHFDLSLESRRATGNTIVEDAAAAIKEYGLGVKAATVTPEGRDDVGSPNRIVREAIGGKVIVRTGRRLPGVTPIAGVHHPISVVRMAVEDAYGAPQWREGDPGAEDEVAYRTEHVTRSTCRAVSEYAFRMARSMGARVYGGPKWTVSPIYEGMLKEELDAAAARHPEIEYRPVLIDATYAGLLSGATDAPLVIPALNRDGDCLSDLVLPMFGSIAGAESLLLAFDGDYNTTCAMAEAPHGTAPALLGKDIANPLAMILACGAIMHQAAGRHGALADRASRAIYESALETVAAGIKTPDLGGSVGTAAFTSAVLERIASKLDVWASLGTAG